jgi:hypothetical protein
MSLLAMSLLVAWVYKRLWMYFFLAFCISFLVRWQLALFVVVIGYALSPFNPIRRNRALFLCGLLVAISVAYLFVGDSFNSVNDNAQRGAALDEGSGIYTIFNSAQQKGFYFLVFIPKALHAMYGLIFRIGNVSDFSDVYNNVVITLHCLISFLFFILIIVSKRFRLADDLIFLAVVYCSIFVLTPIYSPRYFYPVFIVSCLVLSTSVQCRTTQGSTTHAIKP